MEGQETLNDYTNSESWRPQVLGHNIVDNYSKWMEGMRRLASVTRVVRDSSRTLRQLPAPDGRRRPQEAERSKILTAWELEGKC